MYKLGEHFEYDSEKVKPLPEVVFTGPRYRITVLSERLLRLEYSETGVFEDRLTSLVQNRNFKKPNFIVKEDDVFLEITTAKFKFYYTKNRKFSSGKLNPGNNLKIELTGTDKVWYFGHPEVRNYGAPNSSLVNKKGKYEFTKGLYSLDGFVSINDSKSDVIDQTGDLVKREGKNIDMYVFMYGGDYDSCLKDYYELTGAPALIPRYALGNWWSKNETYDDASLKNLIVDFEENEIPLSIILLNHEWHLRNTESAFNHPSCFTFNNEKFKNPLAMIDYLHSKGIRIGLSVDPTEGIYPIEQNYTTINNYIQSTNNGYIPFNVLETKVLDLYLKVLIHPLDSINVDFYWVNSENKKNHDEKFVLNHYHFNDMKRNYQRRPMLLSTNTNIAPHRYPVLYAGKSYVNWNTLKLIPFFNASATNNGTSWWSHDIGGYYKGVEDNELFTRFVQLGVFSPILKLGSEAGKYYKREPWRWSVKTYSITKDYLRLRHRLIPYLYSEAYRYHKEGKPLITPLFYRYKEMYDDMLYRNEYYFGSEFFVAPIVNKKDYVMNRSIHKFYIPDGIWYDFVTGKKFPGPKNYVSFFKEQDYPVFAKAGSIIPLGENENIFDTTPPTNMDIHIFPGQSSSYDLYEDDGLSDLHRKGFFIKTLIEFNYMPNNYSVIIRAIEGKSGIIPAKRNYKIRFRNCKKANDVISYINDQKIDNKSYLDGSDFIVEVQNVSTTGQLTINCKGKDIEIDAIHLINDEIEGIISDLQIETEMKVLIDKVIYSDVPVKKKRIAIRKLSGKGLDRKFIRLFLKLLEYIDQV